MEEEAIIAELIRGWGQYSEWPVPVQAGGARYWRAGVNKCCQRKAVRISDYGLWR